MGSTRFTPEVVPQGVYDTSTNQLAPLGATVHFDDGREFVYCEVGGTAAVNGRLYQSEVAEVAAFTDGALGTENTGDRIVNFTPGGSTAAENAFAEGYLIITDDTGAIANAGPSYKVSGHAAVSSSTAFDLTLYDPLWEGIAAASTGTLVKHPCKDVIIHPSPPTAGLVGIPIRDHAANAFGWFQTKGICGCLQQGALTNGQPCVASDTVDGAVADMNATYVVDENIVGESVVDAGDGDVGVINLRLS